MTVQNSAPTIDEIMLEMNRMRAELNELKSKANRQPEISQTMSQPEINIQPKTAVTNTRRKTLKRLGMALLGGAVAATAMTAAPAAQAKMSANPQGNGLTDKVGMLVANPGAAAPENSIGLGTNNRVGLIAYANVNQEFNLSDLTRLAPNNTGVAGIGLAPIGQGTIGVYGKGTTGVSAEGTSNGVYGTSSATSGIAVYGNATGIDSQGVSGQSDKGLGVHAASTTGIPLRINSGAQPTTGNPQLGDFYVNSSDNSLYFHNGTAWKKVTIAS